MKHRYGLSLALVGCSFAIAIADDRPSYTGSASLRPVKQVEPGPKPSVVQEGPSGFTPGDEKVVVDDDSPTMFECSTSLFSNMYFGCKDWLSRRMELTTLRSWAGSDREGSAGDVEDPYWLRFDVLWGWFRPARVPPMLTTSTPQSSLGILGNPGTSILFGGGDVNLQTHVGGKATFGFWLEPSQAWGFETSYFFFANRTNGVQISSNGNFLLAEPYFDVLSGVQNSFPIANEAIANPQRNAFFGYVDQHTTSRLQGLNVLALNNAFCGPNGRVDWEWGYRYLRLDEGLHNNVIQAQPTPPFQQFGTHVFVYDDFGGENSFHGFDFGMRTEWRWGCWTLDVNSRLALGATRGTTQIFGHTTTITPPGNVTRNPGGIYALTSNSGNNTEVRFSVVPEIEAGIGYEFWDHMRLTLQYNFLAWTQVVRPWDQVDTRINPNLFPPAMSGGSVFPERKDVTTSFWLNGLALGLEIRY